MHTRAGTAIAKGFAMVTITMILIISGWAQATEKILYSFTA
jgi:hypothetical protein